MVEHVENRATEKPNGESVTVDPGTRTRGGCPKDNTGLKP